VWSVLAILLPTVVFAQDPPVTQVTIIEKPKRSQAIAGRNNLYCAGFIQASAINTENKIIGGHDEAERFTYVQNDYVFVNMGNDKGVKVGDMFAVVRPRASVKSAWSKKDDLGFYVQEVGVLEIVNVKGAVSVARVKTSCDNFLLGDLVEPVPVRTSPVVGPQAQFDRFADPSGKATGRILMARDNQEMITRDQIAYVDLGADDNVQVGDKLTVFRNIEKGNLFHHPDRESVSARDYGFQSETYKGGKFSNQASRKSGDKANDQEVRTRDIRNERPKDLRKVVGEAVVLNVKERTATIVVTRTGQEIHTGDWVEIQ